MNKRINIYLNVIIIFSLLIFPSLSNATSTREKQTITVEEIKNSATDFLYSTLPWEKEQLEIDIYYQGGKIEIPSGEKLLVYKSFPRCLF